MTLRDKELVDKIKAVIDRFIADQNQTTPRFGVQQVPEEIHGYLADMLFVDKADNEILVSFIIGLLYPSSPRTDAEVLRMLNDISFALSKLKVDK